MRGKLVAGRRVGRESFDAGTSVPEKRNTASSALPPEMEASPLEMAFVATNARPERLDRVLCAGAPPPSLSRERVKQAILGGCCLVDGDVCCEPARKIRQGQRVRLEVAAPSSPLEPSLEPVDVVYEDADIAVINKPAGLTVHPCPSCDEETLTQRLLWRFPQLKVLGGLRPGIVHRLDKDTSGLMVVALSERARLPLVRAFAERVVHKTYLALVKGVAPENGQCAEPIGRHPTLKVKMAVIPAGRAALTEWKRLYADDEGLFSLLALQIHTGRTHQIRVHMQWMGYPLWGDSLYGAMLPGRKNAAFLPDKQNRMNRLLASEAMVAPRQMLHAWRLRLNHPVTGMPLSFTSFPPEDFWSTAAALHARMPRIIITGCPGCGKSAFSKALVQRGVSVWSADEEVHRLYAPNGEISSLLRQRYGTRYVDEDGTVNKAALLQAMKSEPGFRASIEAVVHPMVNAAREAFFCGKERLGEPLAAAEVPLWFESSAKRALLSPEARKALYIVGVGCDEQIRHARLAHNRGWSEETIAAMDSWQWPEHKKLSSCDIVVPNNGTLDELVASAAGLCDKILHDTSIRSLDWLQNLRDLVETLDENK